MFVGLFVYLPFHLPSSDYHLLILNGMDTFGWRIDFGSFSFVFIV